VRLHDRIQEDDVRNRSRHHASGTRRVCRLLALVLGTATAWTTSGEAQTFLKLTAASGNPIVTDAIPASAAFNGCAWVDYDHDGDQDLFIVQQGLYRNDGGGVFVKISSGPNGAPGKVGTTWADMDNDGDLDCFLSGGDVFNGSAIGGSILYRNDGGGVFAPVLGGALSDSLGNRGWGSAWGDYDGDGLVDLAIASPLGFLGITNPPRLFHNDGGGAFTRMDTSIVSAETGTFTVPTWSDFDEDGDPDLFIASGPANGTRAPDFLYLNHLVSRGVAFFTRLTSIAPATDTHDAQVYNWVDIDEDGDLDLYITNYGGPSLSLGFANELYRNDAGVFTRMTTAQAGTIVSDRAHSLASVWGDYDNDGDMDCLVTNDATELSAFYLNNGSGFFTLQTTSVLRSAGPHYGAAAADYDADGDLDLYMCGSGTTRGLYNNQSPSTNGWLDVLCVGTFSNRAAIGARVRIRATLGGVSRTIVQEVSAQNSFNSQNALVQHFGLGNATVVDSVIVRFPSGAVSIRTAVSPRQKITVTEDASTAVTASIVSAEASPGQVRLVWQLGEPASPRATVYRRSTAEGWSRISDVWMDGTNRIVFEDRDVARGGRFDYRLGVIQGGGEAFLAEISVDVPSAVAFGLERLAGSPSGPLQLLLTLPRKGDVTLEAFDASGRSRARMTGSGWMPGSKSVTFEETGQLEPGLYWVRMRQGSRTAMLRAVVLR
jgi:enediyne biosynthesis protein E4